MSKRVSYKVVARPSIPGDKNSLIKYYGSVNCNGDISTNEMAQRMQLESTLTKADILAVLSSLENVIVDSLRNGEIVRLADLGSLSIGITSKGVDIEKDYTSALIKGAHIKFRPGPALTSFLKEISYYKLNPVKSEEVEEGDPTVVEPTD